MSISSMLVIFDVKELVAIVVSPLVRANWLVIQDFE